MRSIPASTGSSSRPTIGMRFVAFLALSTPAPTEEKVYTLDTFQVTTTKDRGYLAGNSVSATRIDSTTTGASTVTVTLLLALRPALSVTRRAVVYVPGVV